MTRITLTVTETAELIGVHRNTVYNLVREGQIPYVRVRDRILFHRDVVEAWLRGETVHAKQA
ncbi:helix-turn-helix domain-containing protein [Paenibacillus macerans]|uniref:helix-turn-helix domain-containing protein n=1 Tax=Paenibacillus macerans TaxID=44252 RepID=UPI002DB8A590|nr:helix-turn-helix domain-containing protein [Paenibacillus macerans]MEC0329334.1 helix-turn-helix domain-containing protein [Paenibacillus macerans]